EQQRKTAKSLEALGLDADEEIGQIDRDQNRKREQKSQQQLLAASGIFGGIPVDLGMRPQMPADIGGQPKSIEPDGDEFQRRASSHQPKKITALTVKYNRYGWQRRRLLPDKAHLVHGSTSQGISRHLNLD